MKILRKEIDTKADHIVILPIADLHIGDANFDRKVLDDMLARLESEPNVYCCLLGDLMNNAVKTSVSDIYSEVLPPLDQVRECAKIFKPVKEKILFGIGGNHEARTWRNDGIDMTYLFFAQLGIEDLYSDTTAVLFLKTGQKAYGRHKDQKVPYSIYATHGNGGGRKMGGKINRLVDYGNVINTDIYLCGHTHSPAVVRQSFFDTDARWGSVVEMDKLFVNTAASLKYGGYGDTQGYTPGSRKYPQIILDTHFKRAEAIL